MADALRRLFADRHRGWLALLFAGALAVLWFDFGRMVAGRLPDTAQIAAAPQRYAGLEVRLGYALVRRLTAAGFEAEVQDRLVPFVGSVPGLQVGAIVSLRGEVLADGRIRLLEAYLHPRRRTKWLVSGSTALLVAALGAGWYWQAKRGRLYPPSAPRGGDA